MTPSATPGNNKNGVFPVLPDVGLIFRPESRIANGAGLRESAAGGGEEFELRVANYELGAGGRWTDRNDLQAEARTERSWPVVCCAMGDVLERPFIVRTRQVT